LIGCSYQQLFDFVENSLAALQKLSFARVILTVTANDRCARIEESNFYKMHLQEAMQRLEMESEASGHTCVLFVDSISSDQDRHLRDAYHAIYQDGDFIKKYRHIVDSLNLVYSHHSIGIQLADFIAGCSCGFLRGYPESVKLFKAYVRPLLRVGWTGNIMGYGVREVPRSQLFRTELSAKIVPTSDEIVAAKLKEMLARGPLS
jgi:hypothetical protein